MKHGWGRRAFEAAATPVNLLRVAVRARGSRAVILHNGRFRALPPDLLFSVFCRRRRGRFSSQPNLEILLVHNRPEKTLMERSLDYLGLTGYTVLRTDPKQPWTHTTRVTELRKYLNSGECTADYVLASDCDDAFLRDDPQIAVDLLERANCDMLVSSTSYTLYRNLPGIQQRTEALAPPEFRTGRRPRIHLNAGVFIARTTFLREYLEAAAEYVTEHDLQSQKLLNVPDEELLKQLPDFPKGFGSDQTIMRLLLPRFHPRMQIDYRSELALR